MTPGQNATKVLRATFKPSGAADGDGQHSSLDRVIDRLIRLKDDQWVQTQAGSWPVSLTYLRNYSSVLQQNGEDNQFNVS